MEQDKKDKESNGGRALRALTAACLVLGLLFLGCTSTGGGEDAAVKDGGADAGSGADAGTDAGPPATIEADRMHDDVAFLAADGLGGRKPGTEGNRMAVDYLEERFREIGLEPAGDDGSHLRSFRFVTWALSGPAEMILDGKTLEPGRDFRAVKLSGPADLEAEVVFAGYGMTVPPFKKADHPSCPLDPAGYDDYAGVDVTGKLVLVLSNGPSENENVNLGCPANETCESSNCLWEYLYKAKNARGHGAAGLLVVQNYEQEPAPDKGARFGADVNSVTLYLEFPSVTVDRSRMEAALPDLPEWAARIDEDLAPRSRATGVRASMTFEAGLIEIESANVLGKISGTDPVHGSEVIVVGAHLDHLGTDPWTGDIYHGANDNASGTSIVMELGRVMARNMPEPKRTVLFAAWNGEELGLRGSLDYVLRPTLPVEDTRAAFSLDNAGAGVGAGVALTGGTEPLNAWLVELMTRSAAEKGMDYMALALPKSSNSDHFYFFMAGVPAVLVSAVGDATAFHHTPDDTADKVTKPALEGTARMMWSVLEPLAMATEDEFLER